MNEHPLTLTSASRSDPRALEYVVIFMSGVLLRLPFLPATVDDAFIIFRYVRNLIAGQGYVFNVGERVLGTTTPFYTLYLALLGKSGLDYILVGKLTNIVADTASPFTLQYDEMMGVPYNQTSSVKAAWSVP